MAKVQVILPAMGEGIIEAEITRWLVSEGESVETDQPLVEVATDKVDSEIPAPRGGVLHKIMAHEGEVPKIGQVLAIISTGGEVTADAEAHAPPDEEPPETDQPDSANRSAEKVPIPPVKAEKPPAKAMFSTDHLAGMAFLAPVVRKIAREHNLDPGEIAGIKGSGAAGRITRRDIEAYLSGRQVEDPIPSPAKDHTHTHTHTDTQMHTPFDRMRQKIAEHMVYSKRVAPHVTSFVEADVTEMVDWRNRVKDEFLQRYGDRLTLTTLIMEAVARALSAFPDINVSVEGDTIIQKSKLNIGMATALPDGNLIVPVIREADQLNLVGLAKRVNDLAGRARAGKLKPEEIQGGTFTVTNIGSFGNIAGTPIINQPESAILAVGSIRKVPAVVETPEGDAIGIRQMVILSLSYDHRIVDGALGGSFLKHIGDLLRDFDSERRI